MKWDQSKYLEDKLTTISEAEAAYILREVWKKLFGSYPEDKILAIIWAHTALETGRYGNGVGGELHCYNFGNIKSRPNDGHYWTMYRCSEIIDGKEVWFDPPHNQTKFVAFKTAEEAIEHYIKFLKRDRYKLAFQSLLEADVTAYTIRLKAAGYFTAGLTRYLKDMLSLSEEFMRRKSELLSWQPELEDDISTRETPVKDPEPTLIPVVVPVTDKSEAEDDLLNEPNFKTKPKATIITSSLIVIAGILTWLIHLFK